MEGRKDFLHFKKGAAVINGFHTDVVCIEFADRLLIILTQCEKLGTLIHTMRAAAPDDTPVSENFYSTKVLMGEDVPEICAVARVLASNISSPKPIVFGLGLRDKSVQSLKPLVDLVNLHKCWTC